MDEETAYKILDFVKPTKAFDLNDSPLAPDYSNLDNWAALPEKDGQQFYLPDESLTVNKKNNDVDVFYIHPTGFYEKTWNSNMDKSRSAYERTEIMLANQASAFNGSCNIYAPEYRQATYYSFFAKDNDGTKAIDLALIDIVNAFDYFIENFNSNKPFMILGHSQGALLAHKLISEKIQGTELQSRLICTYAVGYIIPEVYYDELFPLIPKSLSPTDTNCVVSWSTVVDGFRREREKTIFWKPSGWSVELMKQKIVATNPFSWTNDSDWHANHEFHKSIINRANDYDFADRLSLVHTGATKSIGLTRVQDFSCSLNANNGLVETKGPLIEKMKKMKYFSGDLHSFDVMLFWGSLRKNVQDRIDAFL